MKKAFAIVVGGGPAPGINGVISAATIEAINNGHKVYGISQGFKGIASGDASCIKELSWLDINGIHNEGGSILPISRSNPKAFPDMMTNITKLLEEKNIGYLVTIGGDGTVTCANAMSESIGDKIKIAHVPKTIDNDLPLPSHFSTFGFQSAREAGTQIVHNLILDAKTTSRWYLAVAMGRKAGHLALGIGVAAGATLSIIPEEFGNKKISLDTLSNLIIGSILKRYVQGKPYGVAVLAEGLAEIIDPTTLPELVGAEKDFFGNIRFAEFDFGEFLKRDIRKKLAKLGLSELLVISKNVGYELRCHAPNPFDQEYTRMLGYGAVKFLLTGKNHFMVVRIGGDLKAIDFAEFIDKKTGKARVRMVDCDSDFYNMARSYQIRMSNEDLNNTALVKDISQLTSQTEAEVKKSYAIV
jgi:6-phosphofructokinase